MPKFKVDRVTYYRQHSTVPQSGGCIVVEADDIWDAFRLAKKEEDPEWKWEQVERTPTLDRLGEAREIE